MWLGPKRGNLTDWTTQLWVRATGVRTDLHSSPWLDGPVGKTTGIGIGFFDDFASRNGLLVRPGGGLLQDFAEISGPAYAIEEVAPEVRSFYEQTGRYELDAWSEWCGIFRPFGQLLAGLFSRRLQQLNVPLSNLDTSRGITSRVIELVDPRTGRVKQTAWVRQLLGTKDVLYAGAYSTCEVPRFEGKCVKVVFPLPNGNAIVVMYPESGSNGSFSLTSARTAFGDPGFYFTVHDGERMWAKYVPAMQETIRVYTSAGQGLHADHTLRIWGAVFLRLHYRLRLTAQEMSPTLLVDGAASAEATR